MVESVLLYLLLTFVGCIVIYFVARLVFAAYFNSRRDYLRRIKNGEG